MNYRRRPESDGGALKSKVSSLAAEGGRAHYLGEFIT